MSVTVPPVPYKTPMTDSSGRLSNMWSKWFREVFERIGGTIAPSNSDLVGVVELSTLEGDISSLETITTTQTADINALEAMVEGLQQGRAL